MTMSYILGEGFEPSLRSNLELHEYKSWVLTS
jgi:hypothetical protein